MCLFFIYPVADCIMQILATWMSMRTKRYAPFCVLQMQWQGNTISM